MTNLLIEYVKRKRSDNLRKGYADLSGITGIICNLLLAAVKFTVGALCNSVSVTADAVNNLSDSASNIVILTGTKLADKPGDKEHPYGHGRMEYISALIVAVTIFVVSFELAKSSVEKIIHPEELSFSAVYVAILGAGILVKLWMAYLNRKLYKLSDNLSLKAIMQDSLNDCVATFATVASLVFYAAFGVKWLDGVIGIGVSLFIFCSGVEILKQVISPLLGEAPSKELTERIEEIITENELVLGVHDLVIHSYGVNKMLASADAEVDACADMLTVHDVIDAAEKKILSELNVVICIHMDPVDKTDAQTEKYKLIAKGIVESYNPAFSFHDLALSESENGKTLGFDLAVPFENAKSDGEIEAEITEEFSRLCPEINLNIKIERS